MIGWVRSGELWFTVAMFIICGALYFSGPAHADPVANYTAIEAPIICTALDENPTLQGVHRVLSAVQADSGFSGSQVAGIVVNAVETQCPWHLALLKRFADTYAGPSSGSVAT